MATDPIRILTANNSGEPSDPVRITNWLDLISAVNDGVIERNSSLSVVSNAGAAQTLDYSEYAAFHLTLTADCTLTIPEPDEDGIYSFLLFTLQANGGGHGIILPAGTKYDIGLQPIPGTADTYLALYSIIILRIAGVTTRIMFLVGDSIS